MVIRAGASVVPDPVRVPLVDPMDRMVMSDVALEQPRPPLPERTNRDVFAEEGTLTGVVEIVGEILLSIILAPGPVIVPLSNSVPHAPLLITFAELSEPRPRKPVIVRVAHLLQQFAVLTVKQLSPTSRRRTVAIPLPLLLPRHRIVLAIGLAAVLAGVAALLLGPLLAPGAALVPGVLGVPLEQSAPSELFVTLLIARFVVPRNVPQVLLAVLLKQLLIVLLQQLRLVSSRRTPPILVFDELPPQISGAPSEDDESFDESEEPDEFDESEFDESSEEALEGAPSDSFRELKQHAALLTASEAPITHLLPLQQQQPLPKSL